VLRSASAPHLPPARPRGPPACPPARPPALPQDAKPKRVICVDDVAVTAAADGQFRAQPFAFVLKTRSGKEFFFAADSAEARSKWMASIGNAGYPNMYQRTREAVKFLVSAASGDGEEGGGACCKGARTRSAPRRQR
jgi:hypothetical protein